MGKKKINKLQYIESRNLRNITYHKRKKGVLKKIIEIAKLCDLDIYMYIYDKEKKRVIEFKSDLNFNIDRVTNIKANIKQKTNKGKFKIDKYTNKDYI